MNFGKEYRSGMNIKYSRENIKLCENIGFKVGSFDRVNEPADVKSTMEWGTRQVIQKLGIVPDIIYDTGSVGKEPMIRVLGKNPGDVVKKLKKITG